MKIQRFSIAGRDHAIACKVFLPESGGITRLVLGVHGFGGDQESSALARLARELEKDGGALVCFDFPAHGKSPAPDDHLTVEGCVADLLAVGRWARETCPEAPLSVFATSFGGYITLLALEELQPQRLVLRAPAVKMGEVFREKILGEKFPEFLREGGILCGFERKFRVSAEYYQGLLAHDAAAVRPQCPTLLLRATKDELIRQEDLAAFAAASRQVRLVDVAGAGHRFKGPGELTQVVEAAAAWLWG